MKNKKKKTKNRTLKTLKLEKGRSRTRVVYRNYRTSVREVKENPFKTKARNFKRSFKLLN